MLSEVITPPGDGSRGPIILMGSHWSEGFAQLWNWVIGGTKAQLVRHHFQMDKVKKIPTLRGRFNLEKNEIMLSYTRLIQSGCTFPGHFNTNMCNYPISQSRGWISVSSTKAYFIVGRQAQKLLIPWSTFPFMALGKCPYPKGLKEVLQSLCQ